MELTDTKVSCCPDDVVWVFIHRSHYLYF